MHLAVGARGAAKRPAEAVGANEVRHDLDVFLGVGAEGGQLALAHAAVGVELQGGADEHEGHHAVEIEIAAEAGGGVVEEAGRAGLVDAVDHALDQAGGFVLLRQAEAEARDRLGDVEGLPVIVVVAAVQELLVDALAGLFDEALPDGVALLGRAEGEEAEGGVGEAVFRGGLGEHLRGDAARREIDEIVAAQRGLAGGAIEFSKREGDVAGFVGAGNLTVGRQERAVWLDRVQIVGQHGAGHIQTLLGEAVHAKESGIERRASTAARKGNG